MNKSYNIIFISYILCTATLSLAQPDIALANKLTRPVYYSIGKTGSTSDTALNKPLEQLDPSVGAVAKTLTYDMGRAGTEVLVSSKPGEAELFKFIPGKTIYVDIKEDKAKNVIIAPQSGTVSSVWRKTERGYPLSNNITPQDVERISVNSHDIPATNPQAFWAIYAPRGHSEAAAEPRVILSIPAGQTFNKDIVYDKIYTLMKKWHPQFNTTPGAAAIYNLIVKAGSEYIPELKQLVTQ